MLPITATQSTSLQGAIPMQLVRSCAHLHACRPRSKRVSGVCEGLGGLTWRTRPVQALAKEGSFAFLNVRASAVMDMHFGNSNKNVAAVFSLAAKLQPCIIFVGAQTPVPHEPSRVARA